MSQRLHVLLPEVPHVQLSPEQFSVYARKQSQPGTVASYLSLPTYLWSFLSCAAKWPREEENVPALDVAMYFDFH